MMISKPIPTTSTLSKGTSYDNFYRSRKTPYFKKKEVQQQRPARYDKIEDDITKGHFNNLEKLNQYRMDESQMKEK